MVGGGPTSDVRVLCNEMRSIAVMMIISWNHPIIGSACVCVGYSSPIK